jgi:hypothetical protein
MSKLAEYDKSKFNKRVDIVRLPNSYSTDAENNVAENNKSRPLQLPEAFRNNPARRYNMNNNITNYPGRLNPTFVSSDENLPEFTDLRSQSNNSPSVYTVSGGHVNFDNVLPNSKKVNIFIN